MGTPVGHEIKRRRKILLIGGGFIINHAANSGLYYGSIYENFLAVSNINLNFGKGNEK